MKLCYASALIAAANAIDLTGFNQALKMDTDYQDDVQPEAPASNEDWQSDDEPRGFLDAITPNWLRGTDDSGSDAIDSSDQEDRISIIPAVDVDGDALVLAQLEDASSDRKSIPSGADVDGDALVFAQTENASSDEALLDEVQTAESELSETEDVSSDSDE